MYYRGTDNDTVKIVDSTPAHSVKGYNYSTVARAKPNANEEHLGESRTTIGKARITYSFTGYDHGTVVRSKVTDTSRSNTGEGYCRDTDTDTTKDMASTSAYRVKDYDYNTVARAKTNTRSSVRWLTRRECATRDCSSNQAYSSEGLKRDGDERIANRTVVPVSDQTLGIC